MRHRHLPTVVLALGVVVLLDLLRVWLPAIITIFGQAADTPAELLGAFALAWFLVAFAAPPVVRRLGPRPVGLVAAGALAAARLALTAAPGGQPQLWLACAGLLAGLVWLAATAARTDRPVPGLVLGLAGSAVGHALLGTVDLVWRDGWLAWPLSTLLVGAFLAAQTRSVPPIGATGAPSGRGGVRAWLLAGPAMLLAGQVALSPALWSTAESYGHVSRGFGPSSSDFPGLGLPPEHVSAFAPLAAGLFLWAAFTRPPRGLARALWPGALLAGAVLFAAGWAGWLRPAYVLVAAGLAGCLALADTHPVGATRANIPAGGHGADGADNGTDPGVDAGILPGHGGGRGSARPLTRTGRPAPGCSRRGYAAVGGMLLFAVSSIVYYAAYDLGYPNGWVPVGVAVLVAVAAVTGRPAAPPALSGAALAWAFIGVTLLTFVAGEIHRPVPTAAPGGGSPGSVRVVAYNIRMGFGLDGRLDLDGLARAVSGERPDVVLLSEVDRGWLLNGGHDTLALLARRLRMPYVFAPAADPLWGDAVLSRFPVRSGRTRPLAPHGAPTGAQALGVTLDLGGRELAVVATHLQPPPGQGPVAQAREVAAFATRYAAGRPLVLAGDLNTEPGEPAFGEFTRAGLVDALATARPLPTSPADDPREQIDHVLVSPGVAASAVTAPRTTASDHLPVAVTLALP
ncbi:endonuclease/exonuclease/phosphatase family protein [Micromonospora eburnea]|uniref:Metal-dependent hydrolase, endonuclease/exonuclease/phosphatase family n=1 Tax=Micromonospora eburnea TaxID=227316 RepID=A0A1C6TXP1_9ACTN|nr:endonuclease/exonuclease/phosphatase family protein [Micromonospora eburnea]SCL46381.1 Metal-dependent hydrolase, endonuclease/exonuclease/phosphatase family [Micromonospora eburnea]